jgi:general secretion pathway protein I
MVMDKKQNGFTLLEVMIAISILAIALTVLLGNQSQSLRLAEESRFAFTASLLIKEKLADFQIAGEELTSTEGDFGDDYPGYFWSVEVETPDFEDYPALAGAEQFIQQIDLKVSTADEKQTLTIRRHKLVGNK